MKKKLISLLITLFSAVNLFSLPGFSSLIKDSPGEYVYYQDNTFERKSYIGFLTYDEKTYAIRYFAPADINNKKPEISVKIYFTIDSTADHIELTGEKIISSRTPDDTQIINYIHDMFYELNSRRIKASDIMDKEFLHEDVDFMHTGFQKKEDFMQFGGKVILTYDNSIPLFNLKLIENLANNKEFFVVTTGKIKSSADTSFDDFIGFSEEYNDKKHVFKLNKKAKKLDFKNEDGQYLLLDSMWNQTMENLWLCQDIALISTGKIPFETQNKKDSPTEKLASPFIIRQFLQSSENSYIDWNTIEISNTEKECSIKSFFYQPSSKNISFNIKKLNRKDSDSFLFFTLTTFKSIYEKNEKYFNSIIENYSILGTK